MKSLIFDLHANEVTRVQVHLTSKSGDIYSPELGSQDQLRGNHKQLYIPRKAQIRKMGYSRFHRIIRLYDDHGNTILDTNPVYAPRTLAFNEVIDPTRKLIGFFGTTRGS